MKKKMTMMKMNLIPTNSRVIKDIKRMSNLMMIISDLFQVLQVMPNSLRKTSKLTSAKRAIAKERKDK